MRLKTEIWIKAYLRQCAVALAPAAVVRRGQSDAGAVYIKINLLDGRAAVFGPAPAGLDREAGERAWSACFAEETVREGDADAYLKRQVTFDADVWIIEVEDRAGRNFLGEALVIP